MSWFGRVVIVFTCFGFVSVLWNCVMVSVEIECFLVTICLSVREVECLMCFKPSVPMNCV